MMPSVTNTPILDLLRIQAAWQFGDEAFNKFIDDADGKLVGVAHLQSAMHWTEWKETTVYAKDDVVRWPNMKSHQYARCLVGGTSDVKANMPTNNITGSILTDDGVTWEVLSLTQASTDGGTIRIWRGGIVYTRGDAVRYGNALYRAVLDHTSSMDFTTDALKWQEIYASIRFWQPNIYYYLDDTVIYDDMIYKCIRAHKSVANFEDDSSATPPVVGDEADWEIIGGAGGAKDWVTNTKYQVGQLVLVNGILYRCNTKHRSSNSFSTDIAYWDLVDAQIHDWVTAQYYVAGTLVAYNNIIYKCLTSHTSSANFETDISNWTLYHNHVTIWDRNKSYYEGQIVIYTGIDDFRLYRCNTTHVSPNTITENNVTRDATFLDDTLNWDALNATIALWNKNVEYKIGDMVVYDNELFRCVKDHTSGNANNSTIFDDITNLVATNCWERIGQRNPYITNWASNTMYDTNQLVLYNETLYRCNTLHTSTSTFDPAKWDLVYANIQEWQTSTPYKLHSMVLNNDKVYLCINAHTSTSFSLDSANWSEIGGGGSIVDWTANTAYAKDTAVIYNGILYRCNTTHNGSSTFDVDAAKWDIVYANISTWATNKYYHVNVLVSYNNLVYKCVTAHTSSVFSSDISNWILYNYSIVNWSANTFYHAGQIVLYENVEYKCNTTHTSGVTFDLDITKWDLVWSNIRPYENNKIYKVNSDVLYDGSMYRCLVDHTSTYVPSATNYIIEQQPTRFFQVYESEIPKSLVLTLPMTATLTNFSFRSDSASGASGSYVILTNFDIDVSTDGITYTNIYNYNNPNPPVDPGPGWPVIYISFSCLVDAKYVRFTANSVKVAGGSMTYAYLQNLIINSINPNWELIKGYKIATKAQVDALFI